MPWREAMQLFSADKKDRLDSWSRAGMSRLVSRFPSTLSLFRQCSCVRPTETASDDRRRNNDGAVLQHVWFLIVKRRLWLTVQRADVVVVQGQFFQLQAVVKTLDFRDLVVVEGGPAQVRQLTQIDQLGNPLVVKVQGGDLFKIW